MQDNHTVGQRLLRLSIEQQKRANDQAHTYDALKIQTQAAGLALTEMLSSFLQTKRELAELGIQPPDLLDHTTEQAALKLEPKASRAFKYSLGSTIGAN